MIVGEGIVVIIKFHQALSFIICTQDVQNNFYSLLL